ncbi:MAG: isopentenyl phosphate kinase family protein [Chloroflexi bacterium]|nr:isopentenyl phosphate kinase family protein [Chloroflexota bacterium]
MSEKNSPQNHYPLTFLKLGGSLITEKSQPSTARLSVLARLAGEIADARDHQRGYGLILGHGSGSFGHVAAKKHGTRQGVTTGTGWEGFAEVWRQAAALNRLVIEALHQAGAPALSFAASASAMTSDGEVISWDLLPIRTALESGLLPVVYGDVVFDKNLGGTILSTEDIFDYLALEFQPKSILLAGLEEGVWADYPERSQFVPLITPNNIDTVAPAIGGSASTDVTGGMASKVQEMLALTQKIPGLEVQIFSGESEGVVQAALSGVRQGTLLSEIEE